MHEQELMFTDFAFLYFCFYFSFSSRAFYLYSMKIMVVRKHHFHVDFLIPLPGKNWLINPLSIHLTYHSMGWSISKVSIFIYLSVAIAVSFIQLSHTKRVTLRNGIIKKKFYTVRDFKLYRVEKKRMHKKAIVHETEIYRSRKNQLINRDV